MKKLLILLFFIPMLLKAQTPKFTPIHNAQAIDWITGVKYLGLPYGPTLQLNVTGRDSLPAFFYLTQDSAGLYINYDGVWTKVGSGGGGGSTSTDSSLFSTITRLKDSINIVRNLISLKLDFGDSAHYTTLTRLTDSLTARAAAVRYQIIQFAGVSQTQRNKLNLGANIVANDNSGNNSTDLLGVLQPGVTGLSDSLLKRNDTLWKVNNNANYKRLDNVSNQTITSSVLPSAYVHSGTDTIYTFGTSISLGLPFDLISDGWVAQVTRKLGSFSYNNSVGASTMTKISPVDFFGGVNMMDRLNTVPYNRAGMRYVFVFYGINDIGSNFTNYDTAAYKAAYNRFLDTCVAHGIPMSKIVIGSPDFPNTESRTTYYNLISGSGGSIIDTNRLNNFYNATKNIAIARGTKYVDIFTPMKNAYNAGSVLFSIEGTHPIQPGQDLIANVVYKYLIGDTVYSNNQQLAVNGIVDVKNLTATGMNILFGARPVVADAQGHFGYAPQDNLDVYKNQSKLNFNNTAFGVKSFYQNTSGIYCSAFGYLSLFNNTSGYGNAAFGQNALGQNQDGHDNAGFGTNALYANISGNGNFAGGVYAGANTSSSFGTYLGYFAGYNTNAIGNTIVGMQSLYYNGSGAYNSTNGYHALLNTTGSYNTANGSEAGLTNTSGANNTYSGNGADADGGGYSNSTALGAGAIVGGSNVFKLGNNSVSVAIGVNLPDSKAVLDVTSTTKGFLPPRMTTTQKNAISSPAEGLMVYDLTLHKLCVYTGSLWETVTSL